MRVQMRSWQDSLAISAPSAPSPVLTTSPFVISVGFQFSDEKWEKLVRSALPSSWEFKHSDKPDLHLTLQETDGDDCLWHFGSIQFPVSSLGQQVQSALSRFSLQFLFLRAARYRQGPRTILLAGDLVYAAPLLDVTPSFLVLGQDGLLRTYENPKETFGVEAMVWVETGSEAAAEPTSAAQLASRLFQESPTPLREENDWLKIVARLARSVGCYRWTIPAESTRADLQRFSF